MEMKDRKIFFIRNRLVKNDYKIPQKTSCFITDNSLDTQKQYISSKNFCSTQNSFRDSIHSSQEKPSKPCKLEIPSITLSNFKKLQLLINSKRKIKNSTKLPNPDKTLNKNEDIPLSTHHLASHLSTLHPSPSFRLYASLRKKINPLPSTLSIPSIHSPPPPSSSSPFSPPSSYRPSPPPPQNSCHPSPPPPSFSPTPPPPPKGKRFSIEFTICEGINNLLKNNIFLRVLRDFGENVNFLRETVGLNSSARILQKISGYTNQIGFLLVNNSKTKADALLHENNENNDMNLNSAQYHNLSLENLTERIKMSYNLVTGDKVEGCFDEKFLHVLVYYNRNLEDLIAKMNEEMVRNGAEEYREKVQNLENLINSKRKGEKIEMLIGTPQISVLSRMEKIEGELGRLEYISNRTRIKARFLDKLLSCKYSS